MAKTGQLSFYRWAMNLPDSENVRLLHALSEDIFCSLGGADVQRHLQHYDAILQRWHTGTGKAVGDRQAVRAMGCI